MANLTPKAEGTVLAAQFAEVRAALLAVFSPVFDGKVDGTDAVQMGSAALLQLVPVIRQIPKEHLAALAGAAIASIGAELVEDLVVIYPEEV